MAPCKMAFNKEEHSIDEFDRDNNRLYRSGMKITVFLSGIDDAEHAVRWKPSYVAVVILGGLSGIREDD